MAYVARYGHQPISEIRALTTRELAEWAAALGEIVRRENGKAEA